MELKFPANTAFKTESFQRIDADGELIPCVLLTCRCGVLSAVSVEIAYTDADISRGLQVIHRWLSKRFPPEKLANPVSLSVEDFQGWPDPENLEGWVYK